MAVSPVRKASKTNGSNANVASSNKSDTVDKIKDASKPAQQQNTTDAAKNTIMTRSQSQAAASSKVNEADKNNTSPKSLRKSQRIAKKMKISSK